MISDPSVGYRIDMQIAVAPKDDFRPRENLSAQDSIVLFRVHEDRKIFADALEKLRRELAHFRVEAVIYVKNRSGLPSVFASDYIVDNDDLQSLPYPTRLSAFKPENPRNFNELPVLHFYRTNPNFAFYWIVECDVHYSGSWADLFETLTTSHADLLGTTMADRADDPDWVHWGGLRQGDAPPSPEVCVKSFMPLARLSRAGLAAIDKAYVNGWTGHPEGTWPTVCRLQNLSIEDIGGNENFTPDRWKGKHYFNTLCDPHLSPGSFRFRPPVTKEEMERHAPMALLWHPVKG